MKKYLIILSRLRLFQFASFLQKEVVKLDVNNDVVIHNLVRRFGDLVAVNDISLNVPAGTIFGLLGPNGAGKSTTIRMLCTLLKPDSGTATVAGHDILENPVAVRQSTGVLPEEANHTIYSVLSAYENLEYFSKLYGIPEEEIPPRIEELLRFMGLWDRKDDPAGTLSTGNRQRLALCRALLHKPSVLLLDEPTSTLDPIAAKRVRELILKLAKEYNQTFFINSHNLAEVQRLCDYIAIINEGKILIMGKTDELRRRLASKQVFRLRVVDDIETAKSVIESLDFVEEVSIEADSLLITVIDPYTNNSNLIRALLDSNIKIIELAEEEISLEDVYLKVITEGDIQ